MTWFKRLFSRRPPLDVVEALATLARRMDTRDLDWQDMRARCKRMLDRAEKAWDRIDNHEASGAEVPPVDSSTGDGTLPMGPLTARQKAIQQQILKRRGAA
jgi:hypothetical protein